MRRNGPFGYTIVMALVILLVTSALHFNSIPYGGLQFSGAVAAVTPQGALSSADRGGTSVQDAASGTSVTETPLREESVADDKRMYRTPLRIISVAAVALLLAWYIRRKMKL